MYVAGFTRSVSHQFLTNNGEVLHPCLSSIEKRVSTSESFMIILLTL